jgi:Ca-activated chloride channel family protein
MQATSRVLVAIQDHLSSGGLMMATVLTRLKQKLLSRQGQLTVFVSLVVLTGLGLGLQLLPDRRATAGVKHFTLPPVSHLAVQARLSQSKLVQGDQGTVYVDLAIQTPQGEGETSGKTPTDFVVVLDRSPSMLSDHKLSYAKAAVRELINRLDAADRLALIAFDRQARVYAELMGVTPQARERLLRLVDQLTVGSATNIGDGLIKARDLMVRSPSPRVKKILVLSDGETNTGITDPTALARIASQISNRHIVLSTIGMGLGFNEALMAALADHGMGNYSYLEHLENLGQILAKDLQDTRAIYAERSELLLHLASGVSLVDAASYPVEPVAGQPSVLRVKTGQLLRGSQKNLLLTLSTPTSTTGDFSLGEMALQVQVDGQERQVAVTSQQLAYAVVAAAHQDEAVASIRTDVYKKSWLHNNLGRMQQEFYRWVKTGDKPKARAAVEEYRRQLRDAEATSGLTLSGQKLEREIAGMEAELDDAFTGAPAAQAEKRNSLSKSLQYRAREEQRQ